ncbi:hypothetical protein AGIG_G7629 [Arapaima gigas]
MGVKPRNKEASGRSNEAKAPTSMATASNPTKSRGLIPPTCGSPTSRRRTGSVVTLYRLQRRVTLVL